MLSMPFGKQNHLCDGTSRRDFLKVGAMGFGGLALGGITLPNLLRAEAAAGVRNGHKAVINIHLGGGPSHQDMFDLKPLAPVEYRGEFSPISTNVPGIQISEHFPQLAKMADSYSIIRSLVNSVGDHSSYQTHSGYGERDLRNVGGRPALGALVSRIQGATKDAPAWAAFNGGHAGYLGPVYQAYNPGGGNSMQRRTELTDARLDDRKNLLTQMDKLRRNVDHTHKMDALDSFTQKATEMVISGKVAQAMDLSKEDPAVLERYGKEDRQILTARRLVQAGVRVVTLDSGFGGGWDTHSDNFTQLKRMLPRLDRTMSALIWDLKRTGLYNDVAVVMWGEFGRSPRITPDGGRDHWPQVGFCWLAGGNMKHGQVIGASDRIGGYAAERPISYQNVMATLYHHLGIDVNQTLIDPNGRPQYLLDQRDPIRELV